MLILFHQEEEEEKKKNKKGFLGKINLKNTMDEQWT